MIATLDHLMEEASRALARMDYLACEALCLEALAAVRREQLWDAYARILLPLQESRRQRRMIAADGLVRLGLGPVLPQDAAQLAELSAGCVVLTRPATADEARAFTQQARATRHHVEILWADSHAEDATWTLRSFEGPAVSCPRPAPPQAWLNRWLKPGQVQPTADGKTPADWVIDATEALGDAALAQRAHGLSGLAEIEALESCLRVVTDHEIIHQRLTAAARAMALQAGKA